MKIIHSSGKAYQLNSETKLELTRYNPFFNDKGEQSIPISLPASDHNLELLSRPEKVENKKKIPARLDTQVQSGMFSVNARQAILSAKKNESIETSFYLNEGAFYEKVKDISLQEIFKDKSITFASIDATIAFMHSLVASDDDRFTCFQVITDNYILNERGGTLQNDGYFNFLKEMETTETIDDKTITVPKGFYITPFIKVKHMLQEVLAFFDYTLASSFLDEAPFSDMCFLNDNLDTIVNNRIDYASIVPNILATTFFDILRKFNVELIPDEQKKIIHLKPFNDLINEPASEDITDNVVGELKVNYHNNYKQLKLSSERLSLPAEVKAFGERRFTSGVSTGSTIDKNTSMLSILAQFPTVYVRKADGAIIRDGFKGSRLIFEKVGSLAFDYYAGGILEAEQKQFPDTIPDIYTSISYGASGEWSYFTYPYVGPGRTMYSSILLSDGIESEKTDNVELKPMLCLSYRNQSYKFNIGTLYNYDIHGNKLWDNSIMFNGADGIFEKFWRKRDDLLRNALLEVEAELLLSEKQKFTLSSVKKISAHGQDFFISELKYTPEEQSVDLCKLLTTKIQEPVSSAKTESGYFRTRQYKWTVHFTQSYQSTQTFTFRYKTDPVTFYPPDPTAEQFSAGGRYYEKTYEVEFGSYDPRTGAFDKYADGTITVWLEPTTV